MERADNNPVLSDLQSSVDRVLPEILVFGATLEQLIQDFRAGIINATDLVTALTSEGENVGTIAYVDEEAVAAVHGPEFYVPQTIAIDVKEGKLRVEGSGDDRVRATLGVSPEGELIAEKVEYLPDLDELEEPDLEDEEEELPSPTPLEEIDPKVLVAIQRFMEYNSDPANIKQNEADWGRALIAAFTHIKLQD